VIRTQPDGLTSNWLSWGFQTSPTASLKPINARIETAASKQLFRNAWKTRRCVVPADGWFEWKEERHRKQPYYFYPKNGDPLFFAGLWVGESFAIVTTAAEGDLAKIHDRRPLAFGVERGREWIEQLPQSEGSVVARAIPPEEIIFHPVSIVVSSPRNDGPELIQAIEAKDGTRQDELL
jgi:putative SOS response-associated peptidase YedK